MNSDQEALSHPIGGVGNPAPGNSCQRPKDLIGCICATLAQLTGEGCYWRDTSQPLLLPVLNSCIIISLCSCTPLCFPSILFLYICFNTCCLLLYDPGPAYIFCPPCANSCIDTSRTLPESTRKARIKWQSEQAECWPHRGTHGVTCLKYGTVSPPSCHWFRSNKLLHGHSRAFPTCSPPQTLTWMYS